MTIALAGDASTEERMGQGVRSVRAYVARDLERIARAEECARLAMKDRTEPVAEVTLVHWVCNEAKVGEYLASYVVDKLRGQGALRKDWSTGLLSHA